MLNMEKSFILVHPPTASKSLAISRLPVSLRQSMYFGKSDQSSSSMALVNCQFLDVTGSESSTSEREINVSRNCADVLRGTPFARSREHKWSNGKEVTSWRISYSTCWTCSMTSSTSAPVRKWKRRENLKLLWSVLLPTPVHSLPHTIHAWPLLLQNACAHVDWSGGELIKQWHDWWDRNGRKFQRFAQFELHQEEKTARKRVWVLYTIQEVQCFEVEVWVDVRLLHMLHKDKLNKQNLPVAKTIGSICPAKLQDNVGQHHHWQTLMDWHVQKSWKDMSCNTREYSMDLEHTALLKMSWLPF